MRRRIGISGCLLFFCVTVHARWAERGDFGAIVKFEAQDYVVASDGSFVATIEREWEIVNEQARTDLGLYRIPYDARTMQVEVLVAKTINSEGSFDVASHNIERKELASSGPGFDVTQQITIAFPDVKIGSRIRLKYKCIVQKPDIPNLFSLVFPIGFNEYVEHFELKIRSRLPLIADMHDPDKVLRVKSQSKSLEIQLKKPVFRMVMDEAGFVPDAERLTWLGVTTARNWTELPRETIIAYENTMAAALPAKFESIFEKAQAKSSGVEQINTVTSLLADTIRYVGDWRKVEGLLLPRPLALIAETGYDDCKDFTVSTGGILRRLGYTVHAAWVYRDEDPVLPPLQLAATYTNHAILRAEKDGRTFWVDPTNLSSFAQGVYRDIAGRPALVMDPAGATSQRIPQMQPEDGKMTIEFAVDLKQAEKPKVKGELRISGNAAIGMTGTQLSFSKNTLDSTFIQWVANPGNLLSWSLGDYNLRSRVVSDVAAPFEFQENYDTAISTSVGAGYLINMPPDAAVLRFSIKDRVSGIKLANPVHWSRRYRLTGRAIQMKGDLNCEGQSEWIDYSRRLRKDGDAFILVDDVINKVPVIAGKDLQTPAFARFRSRILRCMRDVVMVYE